eukprot:scaffold8206_cov135-Cylindrotheca_fusiformis.AAC.1
MTRRAIMSPKESTYPPPSSTGKSRYREHWSWNRNEIKTKTLATYLRYGPIRPSTSACGVDFCPLLLEFYLSLGTRSEWLRKCIHKWAVTSTEGREYPAVRHLVSSRNTRPYAKSPKKSGHGLLSGQSWYQRFDTLLSEGRVCKSVDVPVQCADSTDDDDDGAGGAEEGNGVVGVEIEPLSK